jgi:hypothetical protein
LLPSKLHDDLLIGCLHNEAAEEGCDRKTEAHTFRHGCELHLDPWIDRRAGDAFDGPNQLRTYRIREL